MSEVLIVGGGLAGAAAGARLAALGIRAHILEKESEPRHKVCGEFLSIEARAHLEALGLDVARLGGAPIDRLRLVSGRRTIEAALPFTALGLTRRRLDAALLDHAAAWGARVTRGVAARAVTAAGAETTAGPMSAGPVLLASGKHAVRGVRREGPGVQDDYIGFKMYFRLDPAARTALAGHIEVVLFDGGYAGLQLVEGGTANLCLVVHASRFASVGRRWDELFEVLLREPHLARRLAGAEALLPRPLTIASIPYGFVHRRDHAASAGVFRLGDQAAVIPSFCGDGMAIALHSAALAARAVADGAGAADYHARLRRDVALQVRGASLLQKAAEGRLGRTAVIAAAAAWPAILTRAAAWSRVSDGALARAGLPRPDLAA